MEYNGFCYGIPYRTPQSSPKLQQILHYYMEYVNSVWWHTAESEFENISTSDRERRMIWEI
jgi:hypothetical protein